MWTVAHIRIPTNKYRAAIGIMNSADCIRCKRKEESILHVLRTGLRRIPKMELG